MLLVMLCCLLLLGAILVHGQRTLAAPANLMVLSWSLLLAFAVAFGSPYTYSPQALTAMSFLLSCFLLGCLAAVAVRPRGTRGGEHPRQSESGHEPERWLPQVPRRLIILGALIGMLGAAFVSLSFGSSLLSFSSIAELLAASEANAVGLFRGENSIPFAGKLCFAVLQLACLGSGARFVLSAGQRHAWELAALGFSSLLWSVVTTQRSYILVPAVWWISGLIAAYVYAGGLRRKVRARSILGAGLATLAFGALVLAIRLVRTGDVMAASGPTSESLIESSRPWLAGYVASFSSFYVQAMDEGSSRSWSPLLGGFQALIGQGGDELSGGYEYIGNGDFSNASTVLRFFVGGGGVVGAAIIVFLLGFVCQVAYRRAREGSVLASIGYACAAAGILWSPNSWFFGYGGRLLVIVLAVALLAAVSLRRRRLHASPGPVADSHMRTPGKRVERMPLA